MDTLTPEKRHENMSHIHGKDSKPEVIVRHYLFSRGLRYRKNDKRLPGHPDIVLPKYRTVIFVNGCFWHGHKGCRFFRIPSTNVDFWKTKILNNINRDEKVFGELKTEGWQVITIWECQVRKTAERDIILDEVFQTIIEHSFKQPTPKKQLNKPSQITKQN